MGSDTAPVLGRAFRLATLVALGGWVVVLLFPFVPAPLRTWLLGGALSALCVLYLLLLALGGRYDTPDGKPRGNFTTLRGVISLFRTPRVVLVGWIHFLAFDLFVGASIAFDAEREGLSHAWLLPVYGLTFMYGPIGLLAYMAVRLVLG
ncbi:MAG: abscisic acid-deficient protein Aba4 family protein [Polyangiales bacterium]|nr:DUF4281 domain-containing protein [Sandaracinaceae bacterium]